MSLCNMDLVVGTLTNGTIGHILLLGIFDNLPML